MQTCLGTLQSKQGKTVVLVNLDQHRKVKAITSNRDLCQKDLPQSILTESVTQGLGAPFKNVFEKLPAV